MRPSTRDASCTSPDLVLASPWDLFLPGRRLRIEAALFLRSLYLLPASGRISAYSAAALTCLIALLLLSVAHRNAARAASAAETSGKPVEVQMRNVMYHFTDNVAVHIRSLRGELVPKGHELPIFDDKNSFTLQIASAEIAITPDSLANVLNSYVFSASDAPLKDISIRIESERLKVKGKLHKKGGIPFEGEGRLSPTGDGKIRLHMEKIKAAHLPVKGLMDLLGINIGDLIKTGKVQGVQVENDDLILDPQAILPPPHIGGMVTQVRLENDNIVQVFQRGGKEASSMQISAANYMAYRGNQLRFGKLTMTDTDMVLMDMDPKDPFDFYLDHYKEQLVAGYTKETLSFGLRVFMRDYNKLSRTKTARNSAPPK
jgi:hypothetical protein